MNGFNEKVFKDPVHGYVHVCDKLIWQLIQTREFQRLRRIKQLGGTFVSFPTAEHSRFSHSLGVYEIARKMIEMLSRDQSIFTPKERLLILVSALLHDLGHGPFSHSFETITQVDHEDYTIRILLEDTGVNQVLESCEPGFARDVAAVIDKTYPNQLIVSLISSQLDADRLDYLLRDSYFSGTPYGEIDVKRILRCMRAVDNRIVFKESGMHAIEDYILSRYQMYWQVYLHPAARSFDMVVQQFLFRVKALLEEGYCFKTDVNLLKELFLTENPSVSVHLKFDDSVINFYAMNFTEEDDPILKDLADRFLNRRLLKEISYTPGLLAEQTLIKIRSHFQEMDINPQYYLLTDHQQKAPYDYYGNQSEGISLLTRSGDVREISQFSNVIQGILSASPKQDDKLYFPLDLLLAAPQKEPREQVLHLLSQLSKGGSKVPQQLQLALTSDSPIPSSSNKEVRDL